MVSREIELSGRFAVGCWVRMLIAVNDHQHWLYGIARVLEVWPSDLKPGRFLHRVRFVKLDPSGRPYYFDPNINYYGEELVRAEPTEQDEYRWCLARLEGA